MFLVSEASIQRCGFGPVLAQFTMAEERGRGWRDCSRRSQLLVRAGRGRGQYRVPFKACSSDLILPSPTVHHLPVGPQARDQAFTTEL